MVAMLLLTPQIEPYSFDPGDVVNGFDPPASQYESGHRGVDIAHALGSEIYSPVSGEVKVAKKVFTRNVITIQTPRYLVSFEPVCTELAVGSQVTVGESIGWLCEGSQNYRAHCDNCYHLSVREGGQYLDPLVVLSQQPRSRLLPSGSGVRIFIAGF